MGKFVIFIIVGLIVMGAVASGGVYALIANFIWGIFAFIFAIVTGSIGVLIVTGLLITNIVLWAVSNDFEMKRKWGIILIVYILFSGFLYSHKNDPEFFRNFFKVSFVQTAYAEEIQPTTSEKTGVDISTIPQMMRLRGVIRNEEGKPLSNVKIELLSPVRYVNYTDESGVFGLFVNSSIATFKMKIADTEFTVKSVPRDDTAFVYESSTTGRGIVYTDNPVFVGQDDDIRFQKPVVVAVGLIPGLTNIWDALLLGSSVSILVFLLLVMGVVKKSVSGNA